MIFLVQIYVLIHKNTLQKLGIVEGIASLQKKKETNSAKTELSRVTKASV